MIYLFLMGIFRSGTTMLSTSLNVHPKVFVAWQPYLSFFRACRNKFYEEVLKEPLDPCFPMGVLKFADPWKREMYRDIFRTMVFTPAQIDEMTAAIKKEVADEPVLAGINTGVKPVDLANHLDDIGPGTAGFVLEQLLEKIHALSYNQPGKTKEKIDLVGIKEIFSEEFTEPLVTYLGNKARILHIIRDPRGIAASRNYGKYCRAAGGRYPLRLIIKHWRRTVYYYRLNRDRENVFTVFYEQLVTKPGLWLRKVCEFLDISFSQSMLNNKNFKDYHGGNWKNNSSFNGKETIHTGSVDRWQEVLSPEEIEVIEYYCGREMEELGYRLSCRRFELERIRRYREEPGTLSAWIKKYPFLYDPDDLNEE